MPETRTIDLLDASRHNLLGDGPRPVRMHVSTPTHDVPIRGAVVVSHGAGGAARQMSWLTEALTEAGYVTCAVDHHGNCADTGYAAAAFATWWDRPLDLRIAVDYIMDGYDLDAVGAAGFSLGGYAACALLGARIDAARYRALAERKVKPPPTPEYPDLDAAIESSTTVDERARWPALSARDYSDLRVAAAFVICPSLGSMLDDDSLACIDRPLEVRWAGSDHIVPPHEVAQQYVDKASTASGHSAGDDVEHHDFVAENTNGHTIQKSTAADAVAFFGIHLNSSVL